MRFFVKVKAKSKKEEIKRIDKEHFRVWVKEPPIKGRANKAVVKLFAEFFNIPKLKVMIVSGEKSKEKIVEVQK